ncbi:zinc finger MYM-type protein 6-like [Amphiura filiformis]|uniref:zinc finger MYM-type protein 6-like n=1 Tax=Amphiura filiformis TaxID=82378 RepID=UPI003B20BB95
MFPDSKIALKYSCRETKITAIARTLGQDTKGDILGKLKQTPFSLSTDGSSDSGADKQLYPIVVRYYDTDLSQVLSVLLEIAVTKDASTGNNIFLLLDKVLTDNKIPWKNVICFGADNAAVMMGIHKGVAAFVKKQNPDVFILGCPCHLIHLAAEKGANQLSFSPVSLLIPIFYYLEKSSKRHKEYKEMQTLCNVEQHAILKHVCTRWLSLERTLNRLLEQWVPLEKYFKQEAGSVTTKRKLEGDVVPKPKKQKLSTSKKDSTVSVRASVVLKETSTKKGGAGAVSSVPKDSNASKAISSIGSLFSVDKTSTSKGATKSVTTAKSTSTKGTTKHSSIETVPKSSVPVVKSTSTKGITKHSSIGTVPKASVPVVKSTSTK